MTQFIAKLFHSLFNFFSRQTDPERVTIQVNFFSLIETHLYIVYLVSITRAFAVVSQHRTIAESVPGCSPLFRAGNRTAIIVLSTDSITLASLFFPDATLRLVR